MDLISCFQKYTLKKSDFESREQHFHRERSWLWKLFTGLCLLIVMCFLVIWSYMGNERKKRPPPIFLFQHCAERHCSSNSSSPAAVNSEVSVTNKSQSQSPINSFYSELGISSDTYSRLQQSIKWAEPDRSITNVSMSTSPAHTTFTIANLKDSYQIGEQLLVLVHAKDFDNKSKSYGGDFFQAKLFWSKTKASVFGEVRDLLNGSYSVRLLLPWVGEAQVAVRLIHSSEAVQVLKHHRDTNSDRVYFNGYYEGPGPNKTRLSETVKCNVKWDKNGLERMGTGDCCCEYKDPRTGETWRCQRPKSLPCSALVYHSMGGYTDRLTNNDKMLMKQTNKGINGDKSIIRIFHHQNDINDITEKCRPGLHTPVPAGFYLNDVWTSFVCSTRHFTTQTTTECLKDKHIYMMGDSTLRQWFEFFVKEVPTLKQMNQHVQYQTGPLLAVDVENNIDLHWRAHGFPLRSRKTAVANLHYISNEIDDLAGGSHTVIIFNLGPHFTTYPLEFFTQRVLRIRKAVLALLQRAPDTTVIIKTVNTGYKDIFGSDWYSLQLDRILRWAFQDVGVYTLDVWQMTACHYNNEDIHPGPVIIKNEIDILLSFICKN
ncbi:NXPE family member 3-like isoform X2 [Carassius carassius]|uniref:NXPE family member 3-like isoform X2 n=1 Tax=Carassius carassius TaxID=217509 RepID=UPI0028686D55|nr:NXPE family member 3-like isoform X2 [Carassius carassius]